MHYSAGTAADITTALSIVSSAIERALELGMLGVVAVADELWDLLTHLEQVNAHMATLQECIGQIQLTSANAGSQMGTQAAAAGYEKKKSAKATAAMMLMQTDHHAVNDDEIDLSNFLENMVNEVMDSDEVKSVGDSSARTAQDTKQLPPTRGNPTGAKPSAHVCVRQASAIVDVYDKDLVDDGSCMTLSRCVENLRSAVVLAEELGMMNLNLLVVARGQDLLQRLPEKLNCNDAKSTARGTSDGIVLDPWTNWGKVYNRFPRNSK